MKPKLIPVLEDCIELGLKLGMNRAYKYHNDPPENILLNEQQQAIMNQIWERFDMCCTGDCYQGRDCPRRKYD